jgi:hypothetical protein
MWQPAMTDNVNNHESPLRNDDVEIDMLRHPKASPGGSGPGRLSAS